MSVIALVCTGLSWLQYRWTGEAARADRARLRTELDRQLPRLVRAFDNEIRENCTSLVPDAEEIVMPHGADGRWIGVSACRSGDAVEVRVSDRGPGVPESEPRRIFEPFYRGKHSHAQHLPGTGLGLSLVKSTVEQHRGTVAIDSPEGGGAQFIVRLPVFAEAA